MTTFANDSAELAQAYDRASDLQLETGKHLVERMELGPFDSGARILDVGCGTGRLTRWIAERLGPAVDVIGIDPLPHRIDVARANAGTARFEVGRAEDLGAFADESVDAVCLSSVLHWVADERRALAEARRVLRPGGRVGLTTPPRELSRAGTLARVLHPILRQPPWAASVDRTLARRGWTSTELVELVLECGLELVELRLAPTVSRHESGAAFVEHAEASAFGNLLGAVGEELRAPLREELIAAFERERGSDGVVVRGWSATLVAQRPARTELTRT